MLNKNEIVTIKITDITDEGNGVGRTDDGMAVFVPYTAVGDAVSVKIVKNAKSFAYGIIEKIIMPSDTRCENDCDAFFKCGGCSMRHISYEAELAAKDSIVRNAFSRIGKLDVLFEDILGCDETDGYRNKAQYPVAKLDGKAVFGFYAQRSHRVIPLEYCALQPKQFGDIARETLRIAVSKDITPYDEISHTGILRHIFIRRGYHSGEIMLCLVVRKSCTRELTSVATAVTKLFPEIKTVVMNINSDKTNVILGKKSEVISGNGYISDIMCGNKIRLAPEAFYQVNTKQAEKLYALAAEYAEFDGSETLLDLYCGAGTIGLSAAKRVGHVIGVEIIPEAIKNARENAKSNGIDNAEFFCGDAGKIADELIEKRGLAPDIIILDPARKGCDENAIKAMLKMSPEKIVMISCNPATAARDCAAICGGGYTAKKARAVDMFPRTNHVETVVLMSRKEK